MKGKSASYSTDSRDEREKCTGSGHYTKSKAEQDRITLTYLQCSDFFLREYNAVTVIFDRVWLTVPHLSPTISSPVRFTKMKRFGASNSITYQLCFTIGNATCDTPKGSRIQGSVHRTKRPQITIHLLILLDVESQE